MGYSKITALSLTDLFVQQIENMILSGELAFGEQLPPARELAAKMGVSRTVVTAGLVELEKLGFVEIKARQGVYVCDYRRRGTMETLVAIMRYNGGALRQNEVRSLLETRDAMECMCMRLVVERSDTASLEALAPVLESIRTARDSDEAAENVFLFHHELAVLSGNVLMPLLYHSFRPQSVYLWTIDCKRSGIQKMYESKLALYTALLLALSALFSLAACGGGTNAFALAEATYPECAPYPNEAKYSGAKYEAAYDAWSANRRARNAAAASVDGALDDYVRAALPALLSGADGKNAVCSPVNVYMALSMLAEVTDGDTRAQILSLLGADSIKSLRKTAGNVWAANYQNDGAVTSILADSLWLSDSMDYNSNTLARLADSYHASAYRGEMGSEAFNEALRRWINEQTGGLLKDSADGLSLAPETVIALASTIYFRAKWGSEFSKSATADGVFHAPDGDVTHKFMHETMESTYYAADNFAAVGKYLEGSGTMWFLLPDEGVTPEALLSDGSAVDFFLSPESAESKYMTIDLSVPKFDVSADTDLSGALRALGVTDVFDAGKADFSPLTDKADAIFLSQAKHAARVTIDEEGVVAAAYTVMVACGAALPPDERVEFTLDRPFLFAVTGESGEILFAGIVNTPA